MDVIGTPDGAGVTVGVDGVNGLGVTVGVNVVDGVGVSAGVTVGFGLSGSDVGSASGVGVGSGSGICFTWFDAAMIPTATTDAAVRRSKACTFRRRSFRTAF